MFKNITVGIIAVSIVGTQVWIGVQYKKFLDGILERTYGFGSEGFDIDWDALNESVDEQKDQE